MPFPFTTSGSTSIPPGNGRITASPEHGGRRHHVREPGRSTSPTSAPRPTPSCTSRWRTRWRSSSATRRRARANGPRVGATTDGADPENKGNGTLRHDGRTRSLGQLQACGELSANHGGSTTARVWVYRPEPLRPPQGGRHRQRARPALEPPAPGRRGRASSARWDPPRTTPTSRTSRRSSPTRASTTRTSGGSSSGSSRTARGSAENPMALRRLAEAADVAPTPASGSRRTTMLNRHAHAHAVRLHGRRAALPAAGRRRFRDRTCLTFAGRRERPAGQEARLDGHGR